MNHAIKLLDLQTCQTITQNEAICQRRLRLQQHALDRDSREVERRLTMHLARSPSLSFSARPARLVPSQSAGELLLHG